VLSQIAQEQVMSLKSLLWERAKNAAHSFSEFRKQARGRTRCSRHRLPPHLLMSLESRVLLSAAFINDKVADWTLPDGTTMGYLYGAMNSAGHIVDVGSDQLTGDYGPIIEAASGSHLEIVPGYRARDLAINDADEVVGIVRSTDHIPRTDLLAFWKFGMAPSKIVLPDGSGPTAQAGVWAVSTLEYKHVIVEVTYQDNTAVDPTTIKPSNLQLKGASGAITASDVAVSMENIYSADAYYLFTAAPGTYTVEFNEAPTDMCSNPATGLGQGATLSVSMVSSPDSPRDVSLPASHASSQVQSDLSYLQSPWVVKIRSSITPISGLALNDDGVVVMEGKQFGTWGLVMWTGNTFIFQASPYTDPKIADDGSVLATNSGQLLHFGPNLSTPKVVNVVNGVIQTALAGYAMSRDGSVVVYGVDAVETDPIMLGTGCFSGSVTLYAAVGIIPAQRVVGYEGDNTLDPGETWDGGADKWAYINHNAPVYAPSSVVIEPTAAPSSDSGVPTAASLQFVVYCGASVTWSSFIRVHATIAIGDGLSFQPSEPFSAEAEYGAGQNAPMYVRDGTSRITTSEILSEPLFGTIVSVPSADPLAVMANGKVIPTIRFPAYDSTDGILYMATEVIRPLLLVPGIAGCMPANNSSSTYSDWLTHRGCLDPKALEIDPLGHVYDDLIQTLTDGGYKRSPTDDSSASDSEMPTLFVANYDWRLPVAPVDGTEDGVINGILPSHSMPYQYGTDYLVYWLQQAAQTWEDKYGVPLDGVDMVAHSTGGLVARSYIQSSDYGNQVNGTKLPFVDDFTELAVPNEGAPQAWNPWHNNWIANFVYRNVLSAIVDAAWQKLVVTKTAGSISGFQPITLDSIKNPATGQPDPVKFLRKYVPSIRDLLPVYPFLDLNGDGKPEALTDGGQDEKNLLLMDLDQASLNGIYGQLYDMINMETETMVIYSDSEDTIGVTSKETGNWQTGQDPLNPFDPEPHQVFEFQVRRQAAAPYQGVYYYDPPRAKGDGTVPAFSAIGLPLPNPFDVDIGVPGVPKPKVNWRRFTTDANSLHATITSDDNDHTGLPSGREVQQTILARLSRPISSDDVSHTPSWAKYGWGNIFRVMTTDPVETLFVDSQGRRLGWTAATGPLNEIPNSVYWGDSTGIGFIYETDPGALTMHLAPLGDGQYLVSIGDGNNTLDYAGTLAAGETREITIPAGPIQGTGGGGVHLAMTQEPGGALVGKALVPGIKVAVENDLDTILTKGGGKVTVSIISGPAGGVLKGTTTAGVSGGVASFNNLALTVAGDYTLEFTYSLANGGEPLRYDLTVAQGATTIGVPKVATAGYTYGKAISLATTLKSSAGSGVMFTGTARLVRDDGTELATAALTGSGAAKFVFTAVPAAYTCTIQYAGDANHTAATSSAFTFNSNMAATKTSLAASAGSVYFGLPVTLTATASSSNAPATARTGNVTFYDGGVEIGTASLDGASRATWDIAVPVVGVHSFTAAYAGDAIFKASSAGAKKVTVKKDTANATLVSAVPATLAPGQDLTVTAQVGILAGVNLPTGTVTFKDGSRILGTVTLDGTGAASLATGFTTAGTHTVTAIYSGDSRTNAAKSAGVKYTVSKAVTQVAFSVPDATIVAGTSTAFSIEVTALSPAVLVPMGKVAIKEGTKTLVTLTLVGGQAKWDTPPTMTAGIHLLSAFYQGDGNDWASVSLPFALTVT
jgi:hypothetical protein